LLFPLAIYGAGSWALDKAIAKRLATFERKALRRIGELLLLNGWLLLKEKP